mmetsp:Transcript_2295/g.5450  ORF Transcript_2295/g.5450 Transcript_2295/m.5450 type:complete len:229 (+) Transcript_2295:69-755(+)
MALPTLLVLLLCSFLADTLAHGTVRASETHQIVTCGSVIKLFHPQTRHRLHSHSVNYGSGSQQQSVTAVDASADPNSYWLVTGGYNQPPCPPGTPMKKGDVFRLRHLGTNRNLHSHHHPSPLSGKQEVSCYLEGDQGDSGDNWTLDIAEEQWMRDTPVKIRHADSGLYLATHNVKFGHPIAGQLEVMATTSRGSPSNWVTAEGVYLPILGSDGSSEVILEEDDATPPA